MFGVEMMWGAMFFSALQVGTFLFLGYITARVGMILWQNREKEKMEEADQKQLRRYLVMGTVFAVIGFFITNGAAQPKISIQTSPNRSTFEQNTAPVEIVTPPPRYEVLEGFEPLKKD